MLVCGRVVEEAVTLGDNRARTFERAKGKLVAFEDPTELGLFDAPSAGVGEDASAEQQADAPLLVFGNDVGADQPHAFDGALVPEQPNETERKQRPVNLL